MAGNEQVRHPDAVILLKKSVQLVFKNLEGLERGGGLFFKKPDFWPQKDSNAEFSRLTLAAGNNKGDLGVVEVRIASKAGYESRFFRLQLEPQQLRTAHEQLERLGAAAGGPWEDLPTSTVEVEKGGVLHINLAPLRG